MSQLYNLPKTVAPVEFIAETVLPTDSGEMVVRAYRDLIDGSEPVAMIYGDLSDVDAPYIRVHDACFTSEVLGSLRCDCKQQFDQAEQLIHEQPGGVIIYLQQEGRGIGLANKIAAYALQEQGHDTVDANRLLGLPDDIRRYDGAAAILKDLGLHRIRLLTNNPRKICCLQGEGIEIAERIPVVVKATGHRHHYLRTKALRMGHRIDGLSKD